MNQIWKYFDYSSRYVPAHTVIFGRDESSQGDHDLSEPVFAAGQFDIDFFFFGRHTASTSPNELHCKHIRYETEVWITYYYY